MLGISTSNLRVGGFRGKGNDADAVALYSRIIADGGVSNLSRLNYFVVGLKTIYGTLSNVPVCYDAHWIGYKLGSGTGATAGQAVAKLYSLTVPGDAVQSTAASQPLLLAHNGASSDNYWWGSGVAGNFMSTPNASANQITGDIEIISKLSMPSFAPTTATEKGIVSKFDYSANQRCYAFGWNTGNPNLRFRISTSGTTSAIDEFATAASTLLNNSIGWLKVTYKQNNGSGNYEVKFFQSTDGNTYTQIGSTKTGVSVANTFTTGSPLLIGTIGNVTTNAGHIEGKIYRATISNSIGGAPVVDFNPAQYNAATSQTQWTSSTGEVWTINTGTATSGYKGVLVDRTVVMGDGIDDNLTNSDTTTFRTTIAAVSVNRTGAFFAGILNNNSGALALSHQMYTTESINTIDAHPVFTPTKYVNNVATGTYTPYRTFIGQIDLGATPNTANGRIIGFLGGNNYLLGNIKTILQTSSNPNATQRTSTFNLLKTLNNL